ncbi:DNA-3-methyladenine glycosylase I [Pedobacter psychrotolerans]|uniref:DNA-3-methyladenine glycosylase I n=1 Tax=Pedobacter psychrotolerans TaxID=1843235 RepID=A0A4R2HFE5_9SPHI|nr:DNA-3-methyladenine glycosylase I [Pedobacter psychrotolerans]TCO27251.1 DNA-3-methyladenine glycosylase I [Pedobacter psychrotolerans]GGE60161.1 DNA-3-methyladenine glycosylase I [Pedobacter psychrotolerans]
MQTPNSKPITPNSPIRCTWAGTDPLYIKYHDEEWGKPVYDDRTLFEFLILEGAQAGLSWITILRRRENYRRAFAHFDVQKVAAFNEQDVERLLNDAGIIRNKLKVNAAIINARLFIEIQKEFGSFSSYIWDYIPNQKPIENNILKMSDVPASTEISDRISKDMKKRGFKFFGTTICYAFMQATGMVNDHLMNCCAR